MSEGKSSMVNVPSQTFYQGQYGEGEKAIIMNFYNGCVEFDQQDNSTILLSDDYIEAFIKALRSGKKEADYLRK